MYDDDGAAERLALGAPLREALDTTSAEAWVRLDADVRALPWLSWAPLRMEPPVRRRWLSWDRQDPLPRIGRPSTPGRRPPLPLLLCHPDGRIREAALESVRHAPELRPLLVLRCADWAGPVRERARALLAEVPGPELAPLAELILRLDRRAQGGFAHALLESSLREGPPGDVEALMAHQDRSTRRFAHRIAVGRGLLSPVRLAVIATTEGDVTLQDLCADAALAGLRPGAGPAVLDRLLSARAPRVRAAGVTALRRAGRHAEAERFLGDRAGLVRACARYVLRQAGIDPLPRYRALCRDPAACPGAAAGLGECGERADAGTLWVLTAHPLPAVRVHAVTGLRALDAVSYERMRPLLEDPASAVVRAATLALLPDADRFDEHWLRACLAPERPRRLRVAAERLLRARARHDGRPTGENVRDRTGVTR
ncbi:hypothetical protein [Streptomyces fulvorobeus]|uniref:HEAT repeat domain-containing protein n=1 Tax=Streptomyces fulvorobeus TaxID=284028 RepID=A0A7J0C2B7_9ACTN|nr:hypothetical protein [Streptomyces fulvorobeus]NYE39813.1 hypothetical protein [Streptomyces fulvorobeus]GFM96063.1 hypothetical protein Sfulv_08740 [Streptomyces fulvorobeus]